MTIWEVVRMSCYVILVPSLLSMSFWLIRNHMRMTATGTSAAAMLFAWYMVEIVLASQGINTREYRVIGTPMIVIITISAVVTVYQIHTGRFTL